MSVFLPFEVSSIEIYNIFILVTVVSVLLRPEPCWLMAATSRSWRSAQRKRDSLHDHPSLDLTPPGRPSHQKYVPKSN